ncbi:MAG: Na+/H+ antiporter subunit E [Candidatus Krumholzibacteria bacterium]|nr:Na+/H+ antiporter subunit E [Candidatus Krumholzibacteria bacterium]
MILLTLNLVLAGLWVLVTGDPSWLNLGVGLALGYALLWWLWPRDEDRRYFGKLPQTVGFIAFLTVELVHSSLQVALGVMLPRRRAPAIVCVPLDVRSDVAITLLANLITLTPGTIALGLAQNRRHMLVHAMFATSDDALRRKIKDGYERRVLALLS